MLSIDTDMSDLRLVVVDRAAVEPLRAVFPKKSLVIAMGLAIGVLIGMVFVLIRHTMRMRTRENEALRGEILPVAQILPAEALPSAKA